MIEMKILCLLKIEHWCTFFYSDECINFQRFFLKIFVSHRGEVKMFRSYSLKVVSGIKLDLVGQFKVFFNIIGNLNKI